MPVGSGNPNNADVFIAAGDVPPGYKPPAKVTPSPNPNASKKKPTPAEAVAALKPDATQAYGGKSMGQRLRENYPNEMAKIDAMRQKAQQGVQYMQQIPQQAQQYAQQGLNAIQQIPQQAKQFVQEAQDNRLAAAQQGAQIDAVRFGGDQMFEANLPAHLRWDPRQGEIPYALAIQRATTMGIDPKTVGPAPVTAVGKTPQQLIQEYDQQYRLPEQTPPR